MWLYFLSVHDNKTWIFVQAFKRFHILTDYLQVLTRSHSTQHILPAVGGPAAANVCLFFCLYAPVYKILFG